MNLAAGTRLGPYQIVALIGAGGMGEVYEARDTRLDRSVAVKVLPAQFSSDAKLRMRFEREAKSIAQLSHPHICSLFDIGRHGEADFLVMELLEGGSLADRLSRGGPLPLAETLRLGEQIAEALATAHRHGVVHRDLKPGNIMVTKSGAKLLDFGLAKTADGVLRGEHSSMATAQKSVTEEGVIVGTFQYMAPEQLEGLPADARTDIFALGAVLYEMITGKRAFEGKTRTSLIAAIVTAEPKPISELQPFLPAALEQLVRHCLAKNPDERMQSAHDVALGLRSIAAARETKDHGRGRSAKIAWAITAALAAALAGGIVWNARRHPPVPPAVKFHVPAPPQTNITRYAALSPDGRDLVFRASSLDDGTALWNRSLDSTELKRLPQTEGATYPFFSPDGRHIGFFANRKLKRLDRVTGAIQTIFEPVGTGPAGATWNAAGDILFSGIIEDRLYRVPATGGDATPVTQLRPGELGHGWPSFLPDGKHFLYTVFSSEPDKSGVFVGSLDSEERTRVVAGSQLYDVTPAMYARGYLFYIRHRALVAQPFDASGAKTTGAPITIDEGLDIFGPAIAPFSVSASGTIAYRKWGAARVAQFALVDRAGRELRTIGEPGPFTDARLSPDGRRILLTREDASLALWIYDIERGTSTRASFEEWAAFGQWLPDGASFVYSGSTDTPPNVFLHRADGTTLRLTRSQEAHYVTGISPDGRHAVFRKNDSGGTGVFAVPLSPPHTVIPIAATKFNESNGVVSPDGRFIAYTSNESGQIQLYVTTFLKGGPRWQISSAGGTAPRWSADGRELFYVEPQKGRLMAVTIQRTGDTIEPGIAQPLFELPSLFFGVTRDGRFLIGRESINPSSPPLTVIVGWKPE